LPDQLLRRLENLSCSIMASAKNSQDNIPTLAILISGRGSNMLALANACLDGRLNARVGLVLSNRPEAAGINSASDLGLNTAIVDHTRFPSRETFDQAVHDRLLALNPQWIVLAGFMRILTPEFVDQWQGRILISQVRVPIQPNDTPESLGRRVLEQEHDLYINALHLCLTSDLSTGQV